jgi:hypothetical protein
MLEFILIFILGLIFQAILPGSIRMFLIYPLVFILGILANINILFLVFALGMTSRALIGGYWRCLILELFLLFLGFLLSVFGLV